VVGGVGLVGIGVGAFFGLRAISKNDEAESFCNGSTCSDPDGVTLTDEARDAATISNIAFGLGAAALVGGVALYFTAPSAPPQRAWRLAPVVGARGGGVSLGGRF
jgi:serine/threonine-protein kinase